MNFADGQRKLGRKDNFFLEGQTGKTRPIRRRAVRGAGVSGQSWMPSSGHGLKPLGPSQHWYREAEGGPRHYAEENVPILALIAVKSLEGFEQVRPLTSTRHYVPRVCWGNKYARNKTSNNLNEVQND